MIKHAIFCDVCQRAGWFEWTNVSEHYQELLPPLGWLLVETNNKNPLIPWDESNMVMMHFCTESCRKSYEWNFSGIGDAK